MNAEILSVGTELLLGQIIDTDAPHMARILAECGISCTRRVTIGDNWDRLVATLSDALKRADIVVTVGGLGPTADDITRDAIAAALGDEMERVSAMETELREFFASRGYRWTESNAKQADKPKSGEFIDNPNGTAPGLVCRKGGKVVLALPGPPNEFIPMANGPVRAILEGLGGGVIHSVTLRIAGMGESHVEEVVRDLMESESPTVAPYAKVGEVHLRITARAKTAAEAEKIIAPVKAEIEKRLGKHVYGINDVALEQAVLEMLTNRRETVGVAESMTGGELGSRLSSVPGSSAAFVGGVIAYSARLKQSLLGVQGAVLMKHGPVSRETAEAMALGAQNRLQATYAIAVSGNAGPGVDRDNKPVGLVFIALATPTGVKVEEVNLRGGRETIRERATQIALTLLRDHLVRK